VSAPAQLGEAPWLMRGPAARLLARLDCDGEEARAVGGAVRNALMQLTVGEIDVATTAVPDEVIRRATVAGFKAVPTGIEHGTVTVVVEGQPFEVTTLREDVETYGRRAKVAFGRDWAKDAQRRDFTMNALSVSAAGKIYDYVGGLDDIAAGRVRFIGEAQQRIAEDYLRILRFFRFHAHFGAGAPDPAGLLACIRGRAGLETLSRERVRMELMKLLVAPRAASTVAVMAECGILGEALGGVPRIASFENLTKVEAATGTPPDAVRRLGALAVWVTEDAERLSQRLRLFNVESERLSAIDHWWRVAPADQHAARVLLYDLGPQSFIDRVLVAWSRSDAGAADQDWHCLATLPQAWTAPAFPLKSADFTERGLAAGPALGVAMRAAKAAWIDADFPADSTTLSLMADRVAQETKKPT
jgi:poly(A) polymerase